MKSFEGPTVKKLDRGADKVVATIEAGGKSETQEVDTAISAVGIAGHAPGLAGAGGGAARGRRDRRGDRPGAPDRDLITRCAAEGIGGVAIHAALCREHG
jgi:hypothetical protein